MPKTTTTPDLAFKPDRAPIELNKGILFFWGGWPSNWEPSRFTKDGVTYNCVEQYMMAAKARLFGDDKALKKIMGSKYPKAQKEAGRAVKGYDDKAWTKVRYKVVVEATIEKYRQNPDLLELLLATGEAEIVEASPEDDIWGIGMGVEDKKLFDRSRWGQNLLGKALMDARALLWLMKEPKNRA